MKIISDVGVNIFKNGEYVFKISSDDIKHIKKHFAGSKDILKAIYRLYDVICNYDSIESIQYGGQTRLKFEKSYSDYDFLSIEVASKKTRSFDLVTFYSTKNNKKAAGKIQSPVTPKNVTHQGVSSATTSNVPQTAPKVKHSDGNSSDTSDKNPTKRESKEIEDAYEPTLDDLTTKRGLEGLKKNHRQIYDAFRDFIREKTYIRPFDTKTYTEAVKSVAESYKVTDADIMWLAEELKNATEVYINKPSDIQPSYAELVKEFDTILSDITERAAKPADGNEWAQDVKGKTVKLTADEYAVNKAESVRYLSLALTSKKIP